MRPSRGMGAINPSKMPKAKTIKRKDNPNEVEMYAKGGESRVNEAGNYTKPGMRKAIFERIKAGGKGGAEDKIAAMEEAAKFAKKRPLALEMDLDAITGVAASAPTTAGLAVEKVREMLRYIGARRDVSTFHICEGIADETDSRGVGALTALLMSDVIKTVLARRAK